MPIMKQVSGIFLLQQPIEESAWSDKCDSLSILEAHFQLAGVSSRRRFENDEFNDLTKFINRFADILNAVNFHSMHSKIIGSNDIFLGIIKE